MSYTPVLRHICLNASIPTFLSRTFRSSSSANLYVPRTNLHFDLPSFHNAAPTDWNYLSSTLRSSQTLNTFRNDLKTNLFLFALWPLANCPVPLIHCTK